LELIEAYGTGILKIMDAYEGTEMTPTTETSDNAFKIVLPNLNVRTEQKEPENAGYKSSTAEEKVIALAEKRGFVTRKEVESLLGMSQTSCGRLLKQMTENGQIVQMGKGKSTRYCLPQNGAQ
jgi:ATP-dependent DNA helicase RecG